MRRGTHTQPAISYTVLQRCTIHDRLFHGESPRHLPGIRDSRRLHAQPALANSRVHVPIAHTITRVGLARRLNDLARIDNVLVVLRLLRVAYSLPAFGVYTEALGLRVLAHT